MNGVPLLPAFLLLVGLVLAIWDRANIAGGTSAGSREHALDGAVHDLASRDLDDAATRPAG